MDYIIQTRRLPDNCRDNVFEGFSEDENFAETFYFLTRLFFLRFWQNSFAEICFFLLFWQLFFCLRLWRNFCFLSFWQTFSIYVFWRNFFVFTFLTSLLIFTFLTKLVFLLTFLTNFIWRYFIGKLHLVKLHLAKFIWQNFIWQNFIWRGLAAPILSLAPPGSPLATPIAFLAKAKNDVTNKHGEILYR